MLVAAGVPEREIIAILGSEPQKKAAVAPLVIFLRQRDGETVRAPAEMLEVAADVRELIDKAGMARHRKIPRPRRDPGRRSVPTARGFIQGIVTTGIKG